MAHRSCYPLGVRRYLAGVEVFAEASIVRQQYSGIA
jgi:hypothetical protein